MKKRRREKIAAIVRIGIFFVVVSPKRVDKLTVSSIKHTRSNEHTQYDKYDTQTPRWNPWYTKHRTLTHVTQHAPVQQYAS